jgi:MFS family permease
VKITESPISIRQSFFTPYKKVAAFVGDQFARFAASKEKSVQGGLNAAVAAPAAPAAAPSPSFDIAKFAGIFAAIGLAIGAIGGAVASVFSGLLRLAPWEWPLAVAAALLLISGPSMLLAALKLRQRNLGPLLEGTGWAVNGRVKINMPLGAALTERGVLPPDSDRLAFDPYEDEAANTRRFVASVLAVMVLAWLAVGKVFRLWPF